MTTRALKQNNTLLEKSRNVPFTPRGRALHTIDWYMNGKPVLNHPDNPRITLNEGSGCC